MTPFTALEWVELAEAFTAHDPHSAAATYHLAEQRREIEQLQEQGRLP